jgi:branched-chain amino acid transport system permease protein
MALLCQYWKIPGGFIPFLLLPIVGLVTILFALPLGWISLRTRKHTFVVITIAIFFIMQLMAYNLRDITRGSSGLNLPIPVDWSGDFYNLPFYYVGLVLLVLAVAVSWWIRNSKYGLGLLAIRDDEDRALGLGVQTVSFKLSAFVISAVFVGMIGGLHAYFQESIHPQFAFDPLIDVAMALMTFLGGLGTFAGPILGALLLEPIQQYFRLQFSQNGAYLIIYGALFLVIILILPEGILPTLGKYWNKWNSSRSGGSPQPDAANSNDPVLAESGGGKDRATS